MLICSNNVLYVLLILAISSALSCRLMWYVVPHNLCPSLSCFRLSGPGDDSLCPSTIGRPPTSMPHVGDSQANLMLGSRFVCSGWLERVEYFRGVQQYTVFLGVWFQRGRLEYVLRSQVELPPAPIGIHTVDFPPVRVEAGDFLGVHYASGVRSGVIGYATPLDNVIPVKEMYQVMIVDIHGSSVTPHKPLHFGGNREFVQRAFALQGFLRADGVGPGGKRKEIFS